MPSNELPEGVVAPLPDETGEADAGPAGLADILAGLREAHVAILAELHQHKLELRKLQTHSRRDAEKLLLALLEVLDDFDKLNGAIGAALTPEDKKAQRIVKNYELLHRRFLEMLKLFEVTQVDPPQGEPDPHLHKVAKTVYRPDAIKGQIVEVAKAGYRWRGEVLRTAEVIVASHQPDEDEQ